VASVDAVVTARAASGTPHHAVLARGSLALRLDTQDRLDREGSSRA
jgi:hypothetical protein